jgi:hypothetical protein
MTRVLTVTLALMLQGTADACSPMIMLAGTIVPAFRYSSACLPCTPAPAHHLNIMKVNKRIRAPAVVAARQLQGSACLQESWQLLHCSCRSPFQFQL